MTAARGVKRLERGAPREVAGEFVAVLCEPFSHQTERSARQCGCVDVARRDDDQRLPRRSEHESAVERGHRSTSRLTAAPLTCQRLWSRASTVAVAPGHLRRLTDWSSVSRSQCSAVRFVE
jgi:hypothetical protein